MTQLSMPIPEEAHKRAVCEAISGQRLSSREKEVAIYIANGDDPSEMAKRMGLSVKTVSTYRARILDKLRPLGVKSNANLAVLLYQAGLIEGVM